MVINAGTVEAGRGNGVDLWSVAREGVAVILLSPEQLASPRFESLLQHPSFQSRVCALGVDEIHLLYSWGQNFREVFRQLGHMRARFPPRTRLVGTTATLLAGHPEKTILSFLGLGERDFYFLRRSNIRHNVQTIFRMLTRGLGGWSFPDLKWILRGRRKTVIHCRTIALSFRVAIYLWHLCPPSSGRSKRIRMYNALNWPAYNAETRRLMVDDSEAQVIIATASFMVGLDLPNVEDVVIVGNLISADKHVQWEGRPGRDPDLVKNARCLTYVTKKALQIAQLLVDGKPLPHLGKKKPTGGKKAVQMELSMARLLTAACISAEQDRLYNNPPFDIPCTCPRCSTRHTPALDSNSTVIYSRCKCSGCFPEDASPVIPSKRKDMNPIPRRQRLTKEMRADGTKELCKLRTTLYRSEDSAMKRATSPELYLPEQMIKMLLDRFALINSRNTLEESIADRKYLCRKADILWTTLEHMRLKFDEMRQEKERKGREKKACSSSKVQGEASQSVFVPPPPQSFEEGCSSFTVELVHQPVLQGDHTRIAGYVVPLIPRCILVHNMF